MTEPTGLHAVRLEQTDPRLGRHVLHDARSRDFPFQATRAPRHDIQLRSYGPHPTPEQAIGCCTGVDAAVKANTFGNRRKGVVLGMADAVKVYSLATRLDPWPGEYPPDDTGSSGLGACKASQQLGLIDRYEWIFTGVDGIYAALTQGRPVGVGTRWDTRMFDPDPTTGLVTPGGNVAGGHQWTVTGYRGHYDAFTGQCWWGPWGLGSTGRFLIRRNDLAALLADDGDAHVTYRTRP